MVKNKWKVKNGEVSGMMANVKSTSNSLTFQMLLITAIRCTWHNCSKGRSPVKSQGNDGEFHSAWRVVNLSVLRETTRLIDGHF